MPFKGLDKSRYDPDGDGSVGSSDDTVTVKGNDIDTDGDGVVNDSDKLGGKSPSYYGADGSVSLAYDFIGI